MGFNYQTCRVFNTAPKVSSDEKTIRVYEPGDYTFVKDQIKVTKQESKQATFAAATVNLATAITNAKNSEDGLLFRLEVKVGVEGAAPAVMANALSEKGFPLWAEFFIPKTAVTTSQDVAKEVAALLEANAVVGVKMFNVTVEGNTTVKIEATQEYVRIKSAVVYELSKYADEAYKITDGALTKGSNSFGTYSHLSKDLRLPSSANTAWANPNAEEMPVIGSTYTQYIIEQVSPAEHTGLQAVGEVLTHKTTHVFWVNENLTTTLDNVFGLADATELDN